MEGSKSKIECVLRENIQLHSFMDSQFILGRAPGRTQSRNFPTSLYSTYFHHFSFRCYSSKTGIRLPDGKKRNVDSVQVYMVNNNLVQESHVVWIIRN
jgi:hypothetical protein